MTQRLDMVYICYGPDKKSFAFGTSSWYGACLCQVIWKYLYAWHSYGPDKKSSIKVYFLSLWPWPWIYIMFCIWHIVLIWCMFVPSYLKISHMHGKVMVRTRKVDLRKTWLKTSWCNNLFQTSKEGYDELGSLT